MSRLSPLLLFFSLAFVACVATSATHTCQTVNETWLTVTSSAGARLTPSGNRCVYCNAVGARLSLPDAPPDGTWFQIRAAQDCDVSATGSEWIETPGVFMFTVTTGEAVTLRYHEDTATWYIVARN